MNIHLVCQAFNRNEKSDNTDGGKCFRKMRNSPWIKQCDVCQMAITGNLNTRNTQWNLNVIKIWEIGTHFLIYLILYQLSHKRKQNLTLHVSKSISSENPISWPNKNLDSEVNKSRIQSSHYTAMWGTWKGRNLGNRPCWLLYGDLVQPLGEMHWLRHPTCFFFLKRDINHIEKSVNANHRWIYC